MELHKLHKDDNGILIAFGESRIGGRKENQDSYGAVYSPFGFLAVVCDGMGGGPGGKTASTIAVSEIVAGVSEASPEEEKPNIIIKAIRRANMAIINAGNEKPALKGMGSTATVLLLSEKSAFIAHVGDSRVYQIRNGKKVFRTFDHSVVFEMVGQGIITEEQARLSAQSNVITRALGIKPDVEVDVVEVPYLKGDRFMLCTDGIHGSMPESQLIKMASNKKVSLGIVADEIAREVDNIGNNGGGGHDNLTLTLVEMKTNSQKKIAMTKQTKFIIIGLCVIVLISLACNIFQLSTSKSSDTSKDEKLLVLTQDSLRQKNDTLVRMKKSMMEIGRQIEKIPADNPTIDSIKKITKEFN